jgi:hypothetical protein
MTTKEPGEPFLDRWSRLKQEIKEEPPQKPRDQTPDKTADAKAVPPELPPLDKLTIESDYRAFFHPKVGEDLRRAALKKLFSDPHFNLMDGLDVYIDDYSKSEPIPPEMLAGLRQAQNILKWANEDQEKKEVAAEGEHAAPLASLEEPTPTAAPAPAPGELPAEGSPAAPDQAAKSP